MSARRCVNWTVLLAVVLVAVLAATVVLALGVGSAQVSAADVVAVLARRMGLIAGNDVSVLDDRIVWQLRAPRVGAAIAVGAGLAVCGVVLQSLTRNELADPYLLGVSSGASVGAVSVIVFGWSLPVIAPQYSVAAGSFAGAVIAIVVVLGLARGRSGNLPPSRTILAGVAVGQLCGAFTSLAIMVFGERDIARSVMAWTLGSLAGVRWSQSIVLLAVTIVVAVGILAVAGILDAFAFGEVSAQSLGVSVRSVRWALLVATALLTAITVAYVGPIGFVGLTVPHLIRLTVGPAHTVLLPLSALAGAVLLLAADTLARTVRPGTEVPIGVITAVIGAPVLVFLLRKQATAS